jgi:two-component system, OmpR family, sensor kinase
LPIRWRLTLFNALAIGAIMAVSGLALFFSLRAVLLSGVERTARDSALAAANTINSGQPLSKNDLARLSLHGVFVLVRSGDGTILLRTVELPDESRQPDPIWRRALRTDGAVGGTVRFGEEATAYVYAVPVKPPRGEARVVEAGQSYEVAQRALGAFSAVLIVATLSVFLLSVVGAYLLARAALSPVSAVVASARSITESDLSRRLPVANPKDELGDLTSTINALLGRLEEAFARREEAVSRLEEALGRERRFAADASHELRTPLTNIEGYAEMLDDWAAKDPETAKQSIEAIREESGRMRRLVEELLSFARGDEGPALELAPQDLTALTEEATRVARWAAGGKVGLDYASPEREIVATCDRNRIRQVLSILLDNAIKYTPQGGEVRVKVREVDGRVEVAVSDTGIGIREEDLPRIFERFYRADKARARGGAGLGLAIARQIAEAHGGTIEVRSRVGEGSTFVLRISKNGPERYLSPEIMDG